MSISQTSKNNNFSKLSFQDLIDTFGIKKTENLIFLKTKISLSVPKLQHIINTSKDEIDYWNEQELVMKQLSFVLEIANLKGSDYNTFAERQISGIIDKIHMGGTSDFLVARGVYEPRNPYFFIQEFKKSRNQSGDPLAQLLGEMLVAQELNQNPEIYGVYIVGRFWYFIAMKGREFTEKAPLDSTNLEDLQNIFYHLNWIKQYVEEKLQN